MIMTDVGDAFVHVNGSSSGYVATAQLAVSLHTSIRQTGN